MNGNSAAPGTTYGLTGPRQSDNSHNSGSASAFGIGQNYDPAGGNREANTSATVPRGGKLEALFTLPPIARDIAGVAVGSIAKH